MKLAQGCTFIGLFLTCVFEWTRAQSASKRYYMDDLCGHSIDMGTSGLESVRLHLTNFQYYHSSMDCVLRVRVPVDKRLQVRFLANSIVNSVNCTQDFLSILDGNEPTGQPLRDLDPRVCWSSILKSSYVTSGDQAHFRFVSDAQDTSEGFRLLLTAFREDPKQTCYDSEFQCRSNRRCISASLTCDNYEDCTDGSDECGLSTGAIIGIAIGTVVGVIIIICIIACCCCHRRRKRNADSVKHLSYENHEVEVVPVPEDIYSDVHIVKQAPPSPPIQPIIQPLQVHPGHYHGNDAQAVYSYDPYHVKMEAAEVTSQNPQIWITTPSDESRTSYYIDY
ncbi:low-density lipoprotein receptor-related protein 12-like isoform X1 [Dreissena polymorpha]|uniref:CUB domain-containing protein n=1 Tax=Dreissena polymorpha TaxID=45954 RepID=A0A9D4IKD1_DREPO|nr:low-density lipoprotein receptor-related protein 12-like isoform X1 [Dreissena polymorpha]KAH3775822.1 hypothetical protein DPMN_177229 [Dreissena polymorpha]